MSLYIMAERAAYERARFADVCKSLKHFTANTPSLKEGEEYRVYKSQAAFKEGFDFIQYEVRGGKLKKSDAQPIPELNRLFS